jgi:hypothetical protein
VLVRAIQIPNLGEKQINTLHHLIPTLILTLLYFRHGIEKKLRLTRRLWGHRGDSTAS